MPRRELFNFTSITSEVLMLVEGIDDARFFSAFLRQGLGVTNVRIAQIGGKDSFRPFLVRTLARDPNRRNLRRLGIIRDADNDAAAAFNSIRAALSDGRFPAPRQPWQLAQSEQLTVSVAILPDGSAPGDLEELCLRSIADSPASACVKAYIACMNSAGYSVPQQNKARLHTYLAAGDEPGRRLGEAAEAGVWDWNSPAFAQVRRFLLDLAGG